MTAKDDTGVVAWLELDREEFLSALRMLAKRVNPKLGGQRAVLRFEEGALVIALGEVETGAEATGEWTGRAVIHPNIIKALAVECPPGDPVSLRVRAGQLEVGSHRARCDWSGAQSRQIDIPLNPSPGELARLRARESDEVLRSAGLLEASEAALKELGAAIDRVAGILSPFDVPREVVADWVEGVVLGPRHEGSPLGGLQRSLELKTPGEQMTLGDE